MMRPFSDLSENMLPTKLYCTNAGVERKNANKLKNLEDKFIKMFEMSEYCGFKLRYSCLVDEIVQFKKGVQVMLIRNLDVEKDL